MISLPKYLLVILLLAGMGCVKIANDQTFTIGKASYFQVSRPYSSTDGSYTLNIKEIQDSRCPEGVVCIWSGEVFLKGEWTVSNKTTVFELHSVLKDKQIQPEGFSIQIVDTKPYPRAGVETKPENLEITLLITRN